MSVIKTKDLCVGYGEKAVVECVNINALKGQVVCLLGPNGSGKSTILKTLSGLLAPVDGRVYINDIDIFGINKEELARKLAVVLTEKFSPGLLTVFDIAAMGRYPHTGFFGKLSENDIDIINECLKTVNAHYLAHRYFDELSDGEKQKVMIARALVQEPELIVLDEPTSHLDVRHRIEVVSILKNLSKEKGITVLLSMHDVELALKCCDTVITVKNGKILGNGSPEVVIKEDTIKNLYDIHCAEYNELLGSIEFTNNSKAPSIFVVGGGGSATRIYRMLVKHGYGVDTGIIHENDVDYHVGKSICSQIIYEEAFKPISDKAYETALKRMRVSTLVVDSGYTVGLTNQKNVELILAAVKENKRILTVRNEIEFRKIFGILPENVAFCDGMSSLLQHLTDVEKF
jgi:iron complex transport system ATP-binding protein